MFTHSLSHGVLLNFGFVILWMFTEDKASVCIYSSGVTTLYSCNKTEDSSWINYLNWIVMSWILKMFHPLIRWPIKLKIPALKRKTLSLKMKSFCHFRVFKLNRSVKMEIINVSRASSAQRGQLIDVGRAFRRNRLHLYLCKQLWKKWKF